MLQKNDVVKIRRIIKNYQFVKDDFNQRKPHDGDIVTVTQVYTGARPGYQLQCRGPQQQIIWNLGFACDEFEYDKI